MVPPHAPAPAYFEKVRENAARRWRQLDADPELAAPWKQLFNQVQSPRHVVSELLQNADDARATRVWVELTDRGLAFRHDGEDFAEDHFASLCRFAYSNKKKLHTIGFRGIGFKSAFSLGPVVRLATPTLGVEFHRDRFTEPVWAGGPAADGLTHVSVDVADANRRAELAKNLREWLASPVSLLFFRCIRALEINGQAVTVVPVAAAGPVAGSRRVVLSTLPAAELIVVRSLAEPFPADCLDEVRQERGDPNLDLPPCDVELVLGLPAPDRLHVVLPTGVELDVPYSVNGPFVQDPARMKIKDPATSPTNRWLLERAGALAATAMMAWLRDQGKSVADRAAAYRLFPAARQHLARIEGDVSDILRRAFHAVIDNQALLLTQRGDLCSKSECLAPPYELYTVWEAAGLCDALRRPDAHVLSETVPAVGRAALAAAFRLAGQDHAQVIGLLRQNASLPRPATWPKLAALWAYVKAHGVDPDGEKLRQCPLVPVQGDERLRPAAAAVRLAATRLSEADAQFLADKSLVIDAGWVAYLVGDEAGAPGLAELDDLRALLTKLGLSVASSPDKLLDAVCRRACAGPYGAAADDAVRIAQLAAALDAKAPAPLPYLTAGGRLAAQDSGLLWDPAGRWADLLPAEWLEDHAVSAAYAAPASCTPAQWAEWTRHPKCGLSPHPPITARSEQVWHTVELRKRLAARGAGMPERFPYKSQQFYIDDFDFPDDLRAHWVKTAASTGEVWGRILEQVIVSAPAFWSAKLFAAVRQVHSATAVQKLETPAPVPAAWVDRFRRVRCLPDTFGAYREPAELYLRTPATEPLLGVEPFVRAELDSEATKPLLRLLGVRDTPANLDTIIGRLRDLSRVQGPKTLLNRIVGYYEALDRVFARSDTAVVARVVASFDAENLVLTAAGTWAPAGQVFQAADEEALPDTPTVHPAVRGLSLWTRVGVKDRPTVDHVLGWLRALTPGVKLDGPTLSRVRAAIKRYPAVAWTQCGHWLSLGGEWAATAGLRYRVSMQELARWKDLSAAVRGETADLRGLPADVLQEPPFSRLEDLTAVLSYRPLGEPVAAGLASPKPWLEALSSGLRRVRADDAAQTAAVRAAAARLARTAWQPVTDLLAQPWIGGEAVGEASPVTALWHRQTLFVRGGRAGWFDAVADALARGFPDAMSLRQVIRDCVDRDATWVGEYLAARFVLDDEETLSGPEPTAAGVADGNVVGGPEQSDDEVPPSPASDVANTERVLLAPTGMPTDSGHAAPAVGADAEPEPADQPEPAVKRQKPPPPAAPTPTLFERFAAGIGFAGGEDAREFRHRDGSTLAKAAKPFGWERRGPDGMAICNYVVADGCLVTDGATVSAEVWNFLKRHPDKLTLVAPSADGAPTAWPGLELIGLKDADALQVMAREYLLRMAD